MKNKNKLFFIIGLCLISLSCFVIYGTMSTLASNMAGWSDSGLNSNYAYKSELTIKDRTYSDGTKSYDASSITCYPDGSVTTDKTVTLNQAGVYEVKYSVSANGKVYADSKKFTVDYPKYDVADAKSSVAFGTPDRATTPGVIARIAQNDSLTFTDYIDFTKVTADDYLVKGYVVPDAANSADFSELVFTFTDSVDPSIYFQVHHYGYDWAYSTYVAANGNNQVPFGVHQSQGLHTDDGYGTWSYVSFKSVGQNGVAAPDATLFYLSMNYAEKKIYCLGYPGVKTMCADLDDLTLTNNAWLGFPSGKARLSISAFGYTGAAATVCVTEVYGLSNLDNNVFHDAGAPVITIDNEYENMPIGLKGYDYRIPSATAYDAYSGECEVTTTVWFNYGMPGAIKVQVADGKFRTDRVGTYGIVYESCDKTGNSAKEVRLVTVYDNYEEADFEFPDDTITSAKIGEWVTLPTIDESMIIGGSGKKTVRTFIRTADRRKEVFGGFRADVLGTITIEYELTDYVGKVTTKPYEIEITMNDVPVLEKDYDVYPSYISGGTYALPEYYAYSYKNGKLERVLCDVVVKDAKGSKTYKAGSNATIDVNNNKDKVSFDVVCNGVTLAKHEAIGVLAWTNDNGKRLSIENYLVGNGFGINKTDEGLVLTATDSNSFSFVFANAISAGYAYIKINNLTGVNANTRLKISLVDALNHSNRFEIVIGKNGTESYAEANGERYSLTGKPFDESGEFVINYENVSIKVNDYSIATLNVDLFESDKIFVEIGYENCNAGGGFRFTDFGNCQLNASKTDRVSPIIFARSETGGVYDFGTKYKIVAPTAYDVYSPNTVYTLTVTAPDGTPMKSVDGVLLNKVNPYRDYEIILDSIGDYLINYEIEESKDFVSRNNPTFLRYSLSVTDKDAPVITWTDEFVTELNAGEIFIVPRYTVSDNHSAEDKIIVRVFVETPKYQFIMLPGNSIKMNHQGTYRVRIMVADEAGNIYSETHYVTVK